MGGRSSVLSFTKWVILGKAGSPDQVPPLSNKEGNQPSGLFSPNCLLSSEDASFSEVADPVPWPGTHGF